MKAAIIVFILGITALFTAVGYHQFYANSPSVQIARWHDGVSTELRALESKRAEVANVHIHVVDGVRVELVADGVGPGARQTLEDFLARHPPPCSAEVVVDFIDQTEVEALEVKH